MITDDDDMPQASPRFDMPLPEASAPMPEGTRAGFIALIGAPNAGKSTLINQLVGTKVSIVTHKVQTTRTIVRGVAMHGPAQLVFIDTPGIFKPKRRLDRAMVDTAWGGARDADLIALLIDARKGIDEEVENLAERKYLRRQMDISIPYDTPRERIERALAILEEVLTSDEVVEEGHFQLEARAPKITFSHYGSYYLNLRVYYWYFIGEGETLQRDSGRGWYTYLGHCGLVNLRVKEAFDEAGIEFAFPTETHFLANDPSRGLEFSGEKVLARDGNSSANAGSTESRMD